MANPELLLENPNFLVLSKPAGMLVHGIYVRGKRRHEESTLVDWVLERYPEIKGVGDPEARSKIFANTRPGIVHRLDRETSGVIIIARNQQTLMYLKGLFQTQKVHKTYLALVWGRVKEKTGVINKPISIKDGTTKRTVFKGKMTREAITEYEVEKYLTDGKNEFTLLRVHPKTGRTHQIRVHLSSVGHPVVGDSLYGKKLTANSKLPLDRQFLHAAQIEFPDKDGKLIRAEAPLPHELITFLNTLTESAGV